LRRLACVIIAILCVGCGGGGGGNPGTAVDVPIFSPPPETYTSAQSVTISTTTSGATIRYTTDGTTPSETAGTVYSGPIPVSSSMTIKAVAYQAGWTTSSVSSGTYTITGTVAAPAFSPPPGMYAPAQSVMLSTTPGATIRYTTDGSTPSETVGTVYAGPIAVASSVTIRAVAYLSGWTTSSVSSGAYTITEPKVKVTVGSREVVFDWTTDRCRDLDVPDGPARFVRAGDGTLVLFSGNARIYYVSRGSDFSSLKRVCDQPALVSANKSTPESYENWEWLWAVYREGDSWHAFVHNEFHDNTSATCAPSHGNLCWYNSVTYAVSSDGGRTFTKPNAPDHVVAPAPNAWVPPSFVPSDYAAEGYFEPSSIVRGPDGYYYSLMNSIPDKSNMSVRGTCAIRSDRLDDPTSWRAWDGSGFNLRLTSPYATGASATVCTYLPNSIGNASLSYNTYLGLYMLVADSNMGGGVSCGIYFSLSTDVVHWGPKQMIAPARLPWCDAGPATPGVLEPVVVLYPSLLDHGDTGVNFDRTGRTVYLYYTRFNDGGLDRDLVRVPVTFSLE